jgi:hypothetical protein
VMAERTSYAETILQPQRVLSRRPRREETPLIPTEESLLYEFSQLDQAPAHDVYYQERTMLTPELARFALRYNSESQRNLDEGRGQRLARTVGANQWKQLGDPIVFGSSGALINGQHRCFGVAEAGVPVEINIVYGVPDENIKYMDHSRARSFADSLRIEGYTNTPRMSAVARVLFAIELNDWSYRAEPWELDGVIKRYEHGILWAVGIPTRIENPPTKAGAKEIAAGFAYVYPLSKKRVEKMAELFVRGEGLTRGHPMHTLRNYLGHSGILYSNAENDKSKIARVLRCLEGGLKGIEIPLSKSKVPPPPDEGVFDRLKAERRKAGLPA